jgi:hypothetical protein
MNDDLPSQAAVGVDIARVATDLAANHSTKRQRVVTKFFLAAIGSIPWVGGLLSAAAAMKSEEQAARTDELQTQWLEAHQSKLTDLGSTLSDIEDRFEKLGPEVKARVESDEYLALVRQAFRTWDNADTKEKQRYAANLIVNAAGTRVCSDDVIRLFLDWLELYHEVHFAVIREIFKNPGSSRYEIWTSLYGADLPREDSAEADLFKLMIRDLSTGGVLRQERDTNALGQFVRKHPARRRAGVPSTLESAFEDSKPYVLTELGRQFVHYTMNEVVTRLDSPKA